jgi:rod shape-determining protein MreC
MQNLIRFLIKYNYVLLFIALEFLAFTLVVNFNKSQKQIYLSTANSISGSLNETFSFIGSYISLRDENKKLAKQNAYLLNKSKTSYVDNKLLANFVNDSLYSQQYQYINAEIISNSVWKKHNYLTINKGKRNGITNENAVISPKGVVGITKNVGNNFANVISLLNTELLVSGKIKNTNYFGSISWDGEDYQYVKLDEIPFHVVLNKGDTIVTSGYSLIFPEGIPIGTISDFSKVEGGDFYDITVKLIVDFKNVQHVYVINNLKKLEILDLEENQDD